MTDDTTTNNEHPAKMNNDAAYLIGIGKYEDAIVKLGLSLKKVKIIMSSVASIYEGQDEDDEDEDTTMMDTTGSHPDPVSKISCDFVSSPNQEMQPTFRQSSGVASDAGGGMKLHPPAHEEQSSRRITSSSIFEACIVVRGLPLTYECPSSSSPNQAQKTVASMKCCAELVSYAVLYNLALAHHIMAIKEVEKLTSTSSSSTSSASNQEQMDLLKKAMTLYEHAHHILMNHQEQTQISCPPFQESISLMHPMAIASNLGHAFDMLGDTKNARLCFEHLLSTILYAVDCGEAEDMVHNNDDVNDDIAGGVDSRRRCCNSDTDTDDTLLDGFWKNVMPLLLGSSSAPAA